MDESSGKYSPLRSSHRRLDCKECKYHKQLVDGCVRSNCSQLPNKFIKTSDIMWKHHQYFTTSTGTNPFGSGFEFRVKTLLTQLFIVLLFVHQAKTMVTVGAQLCNRVNGFTPSLREMCQEQPSAFVQMSYAIQRAKSECSWFFRNDKWNCSSGNDTSFFGRELKVASRESAYEHAIKSAGIFSTVIYECASGRLSNCGCSGNRLRRNGGFNWGGCANEFGFAFNYTRRLLNHRATRMTYKVLMNRHNYEVGRKMVKLSIRKECICHGTSGSCSTETCWNSLPRLANIAVKLRAKFKSSKRVRGSRNLAQRPRRYKLKLWGGNRGPRYDDLVYLEKSPDFCERNPREGTLGTRGRKCHLNPNKSAGHCEELCCNRGFQTREYTRTKKCNCKFQWCCTVICQDCVHHVREHTCR